MGRPGWKTVRLSWKVFLEEAGKSDTLLSCPAPGRGRPGAFFPFLSRFCISPPFPQRTLPLLENQLKELQQSATEQLQKYGMEIPEEEGEKMFFLIDVSMAHGIALQNHTWSV